MRMAWDPRRSSGPLADSVGSCAGGRFIAGAARAGQITDEHPTQAYDACSTREGAFIDARASLDGDALGERRDADESDVLATFDPTLCKRVTRSLSTTGQIQVPTMALMHAEATSGRNDPADDPRWRYLRPDERARWDASTTRRRRTTAAWRNGEGVSRVRSRRRSIVRVSDAGRNGHADAAHRSGLRAARGSRVAGGHRLHNARSAARPESRRGTRGRSRSRIGRHRGCVFPLRRPDSRCSLSRRACRTSCHPVSPARRRIRACSPDAGWR